MSGEIPISSATWASAFAQQALSDLRAREILAGSDADKCHRLHFLQMSAEKVCKAHLIQANSWERMRFEHCVVGKHLPIIIRELLVQQGHKRSVVLQRLRFARHLASEIDLLSPACKAQGEREENSEYPWEAAIDRVGVPCTFSFPNLDESSREFVPFLKLLKSAAESYSL